MYILKIIDAHLHFTNSEGLKQTAENIGKLDYSVEGLHKELIQSNVVAGVVMSTPRRKILESQYSAESIIIEDKKIDNLFSCVGVNPDELVNSNKELDFVEEELKKNSVIGIKLYPGYYHFYVHDSIYDPIYALAIKYNVPVAIHCGATQSATGLLKYSHPLTVDELAVKYPDIKFIICHMGVPWFMDAAQMIMKNDNVYTDLSGLIAGDKAEIEKVKNTRLYTELIQQGLVYANRYDKILYGSDWPLVQMEPYIDFIKYLIPEEHHENVFYNNAKKVFSKIKSGD